MSGLGTFGFRADIQGLRALAVLLVLVFHIWPSALPGGYVGVDVFFVISGFLITGLLWREVERTGKLSLPNFYSRRIRRLLPAASLVLLGVAVFTVVYLPKPEWQGVAKEVVAAAFYVENWMLVANSVDYLAQDVAPSPVQHYWSLSVEEQFYILWPLLMIGVAGALRAGKANLRTTLTTILGLLTLGSLGYGVYMAYNDPAPGYFSTWTRIWELGIGGLLALARTEWRPGARTRSAMEYVGFAAIVASAALYSKSTPFPGFAALLPTVGAAMMIAAENDGRGPLGRLFALRPTQYLGDISYSLYLWHWPVIIFYPLVTGLALDRPDAGVSVALVSIILAGLSKTYVEDRFRHRPDTDTAPRRWAPLRGAPALAVASMLVVTAAAAVPYEWMARETRDAEAQLAELAAKGDPAHPGAMARLPGAPPVPAAALLPMPAFARTDRGPAYADNGGERCIGDVEGDEVKVCEYGPADAAFHVVVLGDSHSVHWYPAFEIIAGERGWRISGASKSGCAFSTTMVSIGAPARDYTECLAWTGRVTDWVLAQAPDLVVLSQSPKHRVNGEDPGPSMARVADGVSDALEPLRAAGVPVAVIRHTPWQMADIPGCLVRAGATPEECTSKRADALLDGALNEVARRDPDIHLIDLTDILCPGDTCPSAIGNVMVYRDHHHMTATFAKTMAPILGDRIAEVEERDLASR